MRVLLRIFFRFNAFLVRLSAAKCTTDGRFVPFVAVCANQSTLTDFTCTGVMGRSWELLQMMVWPFCPLAKK